jgi:hypothetical protein
LVSSDGPCEKYKIPKQRCYQSHSKHVSTRRLGPCSRNKASVPRRTDDDEASTRHGTALSSNFCRAARLKPAQTATGSRHLRVTRCNCCTSIFAPQLARLQPDAIRTIPGFHCQLLIVRAIRRMMSQWPPVAPGASKLRG